MKNILSIQNVGKAFVSYSSVWQRFFGWFGLHIEPREKHWALRNINFEIQEGQAIGIIGHNGAGKSTLLKIITGTMQPTEGTVVVNGRIASILELGMGFNSELSGRQNAYHTAGMMGFSSKEIQQMMPAIEEFAEIGDYFDQPVRSYSSGMQVRVAFAVATAFRPQILIIDEALSVGDAYFQHKSFSRIRDFQQQGTTLLIVSHDRSAIQGLCDHAILLQGGQLVRAGKPEEVFDYYNALLSNHQNQKVTQIVLEDNRIQTTSGTEEATVVDIYFLNSQGEKVEYINVGERVTLFAKVKVNADIPHLVFGYGIKDYLGQVMYGTNTHFMNRVMDNVRSGQEIIYKFTFDANLGPGSYSIQTALAGSDTHLENNYQWKDLAMIFQMVNVNKRTFAGNNWLEPDIALVMQ